MNGSTVNNTSVELRWTGLDADGNILVFWLELENGAGSNLTRQLDIRNTTLELLDRMEYTWRVIVSDGIVNVSSQYQTFTVRVNRQPVIHSIPVLEATPGRSYSYQVVATDPDRDALGYRLIEGPANMGMTPDGKIVWVPWTGQAGRSFRVAITVGDGKLEERQEFTINVGKAPPPAPSEAAGPPPWLAAVLVLILAVEIAAAWILRKGRRGRG